MLIDCTIMWGRIGQQRRKYIVYKFIAVEADIVTILSLFKRGPKFIFILRSLLFRTHKPLRYKDIIIWDKPALNITMLYNHF